MARCKLGERKLRYYSRIYEMTFTAGRVRGNTEHRVDLWNGKEWYHHFPGEGLWKEDHHGKPVTSYDYELIFFKHPYPEIKFVPKKKSFAYKMVYFIKGGLKWILRKNIF
jgi:hypothetical protein